MQHPRLQTATKPKINQSLNAFRPHQLNCNDCATHHMLDLLHMYRLDFCCHFPRFFPPLECLVDPLEIIERLRKEPELGFLYLTPRDDCQSSRYNPYNLRY